MKILKQPAGPPIKRTNVPMHKLLGSTANRKPTTPASKSRGRG